jgi:hypothetical protein
MYLLVRTGLGLSRDGVEIRMQFLSYVNHVFRYADNVFRYGTLAMCNKHVECMCAHVKTSANICKMRNKHV